MHIDIVAHDFFLPISKTQTITEQLKFTCIVEWSFIYLF